MFLLMDPDNPQTESDSPLQGELHIKPGEIVTIIGPEGDELLVWQGNSGKLIWE